MGNHSELRNKIRELVLEYAEAEFKLRDFVPDHTSIPASGKVIGGAEIASIVEAALDGWLTAGRFNEEFEKKLSSMLGIKYVLTTNSGSSANLVAFSALCSAQLGEKAIKPGDEVLTVAAAFPTTVNPIIQNGAIPVFIDIELPTYNIDASQIELAINSRTKAIMLAHTLGNPYNISVIRDICNRYNLWLIEDCCDALGAKYNGKLVGSFGDIGTLSFYPAHHITMGEGGAVFTNNAELKKIIESIRDWGRDCFCPPGHDNTCNKRFKWQKGNLPFGYDHKYIYSNIGYNLKITDMQAACGLAQLDRLPKFIETRNQNFAYLKKQLSTLNKFFILPEATPNSEPSWFGFPITIRDGAPFDRLSLLNFLDQNKIGTRLIFAGNIIRQPYMQNFTFRTYGKLENTDKVMNQTFHLGIFPGLTFEMLDYVAFKINEFVGRTDSH